MIDDVSAYDVAYEAHKRITSLEEMVSELEKRIDQLEAETRQEAPKGIQ